MACMISMLQVHKIREVGMLKSKSIFNRLSHVLVLHAVVFGLGRTTIHLTVLGIVQHWYGMIIREPTQFFPSPQAKCRAFNCRVCAAVMPSANSACTCAALWSIGMCFCAVSLRCCEHERDSMLRNHVYRTASLLRLQRPNMTNERVTDLHNVAFPRVRLSLSLTQVISCQPSISERQ